MKKGIIFLILIIVIMLISVWPVYLLEVRADGTDELICLQPAKRGDTFDVVWTHSVTLQPVIETYKLEAPGKIPIIRMIFDDNGPNLPARPEFNQEWTIRDGKFIVTGYELFFERVPVTIGAVIANHTLKYGEKEFVLKDVFRPGGYVHIGFVRNLLPEYLYKGVKVWLKNR